MPGHPFYLDNRRARAFCASSRCGYGLFGHFFHIFPMFLLLVRQQKKFQSVLVCLGGFNMVKVTD